MNKITPFIHLLGCLWAISSAAAESWVSADAANSQFFSAEAGGKDGFN